MTKSLGQIAVRMLYWHVVVKIELSAKAKLLIYWLISVTSLSYDYKLWVE